MRLPNLSAASRGLRIDRSSDQPRRAGSTLWRHGIAVVVALMGLANIVSALLVRVRAREEALHDLLPLYITHSSRHLTVVAGLALLVVSRGLWRGKRWTWGLTIALLGASAVFHLLKGLDWEEAAAALTIAALLVMHRDRWVARPDVPSLRRALRAVALSMVGLVVYAASGFLLLRPNLGGAVGPFVEELGARLILSTGPLTVYGRALWFLESLSVFGLTLGVYLLGALLRPIAAPRADPDERERVQELLRRFGTSSLAPFALAPDKSLYFGKSVEGLIAFAVAGEVAVVCGDPIAAPEQRVALVGEFMAFCATQGWDLCLYESAAPDSAAYDALGLRSLKIGEDAWIDVGAFTLKGKPIADIRHAVSKIERDGLRFAFLDQAPAAWSQLRELADAADRGAWELQFSIGRLPEIPDPAARYALALGPDGASVLGFCAWLPIPAVSGWALDVLQRHPDAPNGTMEFLIAQSLLRFQQEGAAWASLGVAPLADAALDQAEEQSTLQRGVRFLYEHPKINELYRYKSLYFFKRKFVPQWRSVTLVYGSQLALPRILFAVLKVHLPIIGPALATKILTARPRPAQHPAPARPVSGEPA